MKCHWELNSAWDWAGSLIDTNVVLQLHFLFTTVQNLTPNVGMKDDNTHNAGFTGFTFVQWEEMMTVKSCIIFISRHCEWKLWWNTKKYNRFLKYQKQTDCFYERLQREAERWGAGGDSIKIMAKTSSFMKQEQKDMQIWPGPAYITQHFSTTFTITLGTWHT